MGPGTLIQQKINWYWKPFAELTSTQLYQVLQLRQQVFVVEQSCCYADIDDWDQDAVHLLGSNADGQLLAYIRVFAPNVRFTEASIGRVLTSMTVRGNGLGHELIRRGVEYCSREFATAPIRIAAQAHLKRFYHSHGFQVVGEEYPVDDIPHVDLLRTPDDSLGKQ